MRLRGPKIANDLVSIISEVRRDTPSNIPRDRSNFLRMSAASPKETCLGTDECPLLKRADIVIKTALAS